MTFIQKLLLVAVATLFVTASYGQTITKHNIESFFNKRLYYNANVLCYFTDSVGQITKNPTHITITNYQTKKIKFKVLGENKFTSIEPRTTITLPKTSETNKYVFCYSKYIANTEQKNAEYLQLAINFNRKLQEIKIIK